MLVVRNLPAEPTWRDWTRQEASVIRGLVLWAVVLVCLSGIGQSDYETAAESARQSVAVALESSFLSP